MFVTVIDDRSELLSSFPKQAVTIADVDPAKFIAKRKWSADEALAMVSRNYEIDAMALTAALEIKGVGYIGMIGSDRKVKRVFDRLKKKRVPEEKLKKVYAPLGLDIGADSPAEIAVSVVAEILTVLRKRSGDHLKKAR